MVTVTSLYPNREQPQRGVFVRERLRRFQDRFGVVATVIAPVPWFPFDSSRFGEYGTLARVPVEESTPEGKVFHPRFFHVPRVSDLFSPFAFAGAVLREIRRRKLDFDVLDAHFLFPDGVGAVLAARAVGKPIVLTARGSDVNVIASEKIAGRWIRWATRRADQLVAVSRDLADRLAEISGRDVNLVANGVDRERFQPCADRAALRECLGLSGFVVLSVGNLIDLKGHELVIDAMTRLPDAQLIIAGDGPNRARLTSQVRALQLENRVRLMAAMPQEQLAHYFQAADILVLASSFEGMPNVVLESLACGTPVVATAKGGPRELLSSGVAGLHCERTSAAVAEAIGRIRANTPDRLAVRATTDAYSWSACVDALNAVVRRVVPEDGSK